MTNINDDHDHDHDDDNDDGNIRPKAVMKSVDLARDMRYAECPSSLSVFLIH